ncbi:MAG: RNA methyltransferase [Cyanobacteria bacterium J06633_2]
MVISSIQNPLVKQFRKLHRPKERHRQGCFLVEGTHLIEEAIAAGWPLLSICHTALWQERNETLWHRLQDVVPRCEVVTDDLMTAIATTVSPEGVVAIAARQSIDQTTGSSDTRRADRSTLQLGVALETIQDPGNVGTIIRSATAGGVDQLWLSRDSVDVDHPKVLRASAGQWFRLAMTVRSSLYVDLMEAQESGIQVVATVPSAPQAYWDVDLSIPTIIVAGNEGAGLSETILSACDVRACIPTATHVESLNVAIAASLVIFEANRQRKFKEFSASEVK